MVTSAETKWGRGFHGPPPPSADNATATTEKGEYTGHTTDNRRNPTNLINADFVFLVGRRLVRWLTQRWLPCDWGCLYGSNVSDSCAITDVPYVRWAHARK